MLQNETMVFMVTSNFEDEARWRAGNQRFLDHATANPSGTRGEFGYQEVAPSYSYDHNLYLWTISEVWKEEKKVTDKKAVTYRLRADSPYKYYNKFSVPFAKSIKKK